MVSVAGGFGFALRGSNILHALCSAGHATLSIMERVDFRKNPPSQGELFAAHQVCDAVCPFTLLLLKKHQCGEGCLLLLFCLCVRALAQAKALPQDENPGEHNLPESTRAMLATDVCILGAVYALFAFSGTGGMAPPVKSQVAYACLFYALQLCDGGHENSEDCATTRPTTK